MGIFSKKKATKANEGERWAVLWNPQGVRDFNEKPIWKEGTITNVSVDSFFYLEFESGVMVCSDLDNLKKVK